MQACLFSILIAILCAVNSSMENVLLDAEDQPQPEPEVVVQSLFSEPEAVPENIVLTASDIVTPPIIMGMLFVLALSGYAIYTRRSFHSIYGIKGILGIQSTKKEEKPFCQHLPLSTDDKEILHQIEHGQNKLGEMLMMSFPSLLGLVFCPLTLLLHRPLEQWFWPTLQAQPDINEAIAGFLTPAGMVYAIILGFAYETSVAKNKTFKLKIHDMIISMTEMARLGFLTQPGISKRKDLILSIKDQLFETIRLSMSPCLSSKYQKGAYSAKKGIRSGVIEWFVKNMEFKSGCWLSTIDTFIMRILLNTNRKVWIMADQMSHTHQKLSILHWVFLLLLGYITFVGVVFIRSQSSLCDLSMCILTVFSISFLLYFISDFDDPFNGLYRVDYRDIFGAVKILDEAYGKEMQKNVVDVENGENVEDNLIQNMGPVSTFIERKRLPVLPPIATLVE